MHDQNPHTLNKGNTIHTVDELPEWAKGNEGKGTENISPDSLGWIGDDGRLYGDDLLSEQGFDPDPPLELIVLAIIDAHPVENNTDRQERLEIAMEALTGSRRKRGMNEIDDYDILLEVAWRYFLEFVDQGMSPPKRRITPIVRQVIEQLPKDDPRLRATLDSNVRRIQRKFTRDYDLLLRRVTSERDWHRMDIVGEIYKIVDRMGDLGIPVDKRSIGPRLRSTDAKTR